MNIYTVFVSTSIINSTYLPQLETIGTILIVPWQILLILLGFAKLGTKLINLHQLCEIIFLSFVEIAK